MKNTIKYIIFLFLLLIISKIPLTAMENIEKNFEPFDITKEEWKEFQALLINNPENLNFDELNQDPKQIYLFISFLNINYETSLTEGQEFSETLTEIFTLKFLTATHAFIKDLSQQKLALTLSLLRLDNQTNDTNDFSYCVNLINIPEIKANIDKAIILLKDKELEISKTMDDKTIKLIESLSITPKELFEYHELLINNPINLDFDKLTQKQKDTFIGLLILYYEEALLKKKSTLKALMEIFKKYDLEFLLKSAEFIENLYAYKLQFPDYSEWIDFIKIGEIRKIINEFIVLLEEKEKQKCTELLMTLFYMKNDYKNKQLNISDKQLKS